MGSEPNSQLLRQQCSRRGLAVMAVLMLETLTFSEVHQRVLEAEEVSPVKLVVVSKSNKPRL